MRMKEDHMKNGQLKPAYNLQLGLEGEYIVGIDISSERADELTLLNLLDKIKKRLRRVNSPFFISQHANNSVKMPKQMNY